MNPEILVMLKFAWISIINEVAQAPEGQKLWYQLWLCTVKDHMLHLVSSFGPTTVQERYGQTGAGSAKGHQEKGGWSIVLQREGEVSLEKLGFVEISQAGLDKSMGSSCRSHCWTCSEQEVEIKTSVSQMTWWFSKSKAQQRIQVAVFREADFILILHWERDTSEK